MNVRVNMNRIKILIFFILFLSFTSISSASTISKTLSIEWSYSGSAASYNLYMDNVKVANLPSPSPQSTSIMIDPSVVHQFTLTAVDSSGVESPQSAPYALSPGSMPPTPTNLRIIIK